MKKIILLLFFLSQITVAQNVNYGRETLPKHNISLSFSWDFAASAGLHYQFLPSAAKWRGIGVSARLPTGENVFDDYSLSAFGDWQLMNKKQIKSFVRLGVFDKKMANTNATLLTAGAFVAPSIAHYSRVFYIGFEGKFERSILTQYQNKEELKQYYLEMKDGVSFKGQAQNFSAGLMSGLSIQKTDVDLGIGLVNIGHIGGIPFVPFYFRIGLSRGMY